MPSSVDYIGDTGTLFVLTNNVYAKKEDGLFYPGSVESKQDNKYRILFADNTIETLPEEYVTWVAFCGLPPSSWPKNPIVQPAIPAGKQHFEDARVKFLGDTVSEKPASLKVLKEEDIESCGSESKCDVQNSPRKHLWSRKRQTRVPSSSEESKEEQFSALKLMRSSVLRINTKALSKGKESDDLPNSSMAGEIQRESMPQSSFQPTTKCLLKRTNFRSMLAPRTTENMFEMTRCSCGTLGMPKFETKLCRCTNDEEELDRETVEYYARATYPSPFPHRPYPNLDWYDATRFGQSSPTSPIAPPSLPTGMDHDRQASMHPFWAAQRHVRDSLAPRFDLSLYTHDPYGIRMVREDWKENASGLGPGKKRRKDGLKKCRKVYGVYNRNLWCTQCKWKKACTRFRA